MFLQNTQQFRLQFERNVAYFIEEQSALVCNLEAARLAHDGAGKGTLLMTEQFAFQKIQRNGCAIEFYESAPDAPTGIVNGMRDEFFSRAGFPLDEDSRISGSHLFYLFENRFQGSARTYNPRRNSVAGLVAIEPGIRRQPGWNFKGCVTIQSFAYQACLR